MISALHSLTQSIRDTRIEAGLLDLSRDLLASSQVRLPVVLSTPLNLTPTNPMESSVILLFFLSSLRWFFSRSFHSLFQSRQRAVVLSLTLAASSPFTQFVHLWVSSSHTRLSSFVLVTYRREYRGERIRQRERCRFLYPIHHPLLSRYESLRLFHSSTSQSSWELFLQHYRDIIST